MQTREFAHFERLAMPGHCPQVRRVRASVVRAGDDEEAMYVLTNGEYH